MTHDRRTKALRPGMRRFGAEVLAKTRDWLVNESGARGVPLGRVIDELVEQEIERSRERIEALGCSRQDEPDQCMGWCISGLEIAADPEAAIGDCAGVDWVGCRICLRLQMPTGRKERR